MQVGMQFTQGSSVELHNPDHLEELSVETEISLYANVSRQNENDRAFLFYLGNVVDTYTKMPHTSTDDFIALEIMQGGICKMTMNMGAGLTEIMSTQPILYDQWIMIEVCLEIRSEISSYC